MARHRRTTPVSAVPPTPSRHRGGRRRHSPVRTGLLASSAALAMGAVAMGAGVIPAPPKAPDGVTAADDPGVLPDSATPGGSAPDSQGFQTSPAPVPAPPNRGAVPPSRSGEGRATVPPTQEAPGSQAPDTSTPGLPSAPSVPKPSVPEEILPDSPSGQAPGAEKSSPGNKQKKPGKAKPPSLSDATKIEAEILKLVNKERAKAGCDPLKLSGGLSKLARAFSVDMALRGFFTHIDPDGNDPWDRAEASGIGNLGAEIIARGPNDAKAAMDVWMASPGHSANILNCEFKTMGVGVHFGPSGPRWTQNFGL